MTTATELDQMAAQALTDGDTEGAARLMAQANGAAFELPFDLAGGDLATAAARIAWEIGQLRQAATLRLADIAKERAELDAEEAELRAGVLGEAETGKRKRSPRNPKPE